MKYQTMTEAIVGLGESKVLQLINESIRLHTIASAKRKTHKKLDYVFEGQPVVIQFPLSDHRTHVDELCKSWLHDGATGTVVREKHEGELMTRTPHNLVFVKVNGAPEGTIDMVHIEFLQPLIPS